MNTILVAVICNLVAVLLLVSGILNSINNSWKLALIKFCLTLACGIGLYFAVPALATEIASITAQETTIGAIISGLGISTLTFHSILYTVLFLLAYGFVAIICSIVKHKMIKSYRNKNENAAKIKRARSINPKAEKLARKAAWRDMKAQYKSTNKWYKRLISGFIGSITATILGLIILMPFGYIGEDLNKANDGNMQYLESGFDYTLNGLIDEKIDFKFFDWLISAEESAAPEVDDDNNQDSQPDVNETPENNTGAGVVTE